MTGDRPDVERLEVGRVGRAHGLKGDVVVTPITNVSERFAPGSQLWIGETPYRIAASRPQQHRYVVHFEGVDDREGAEALRNQLLTAPSLGDAPEGQVWVHEVIGAEMRDRAGTTLGTVVSVEANPAHDLLVLDDGALVPVVFVVDTAPGVVVVEVPEGLLELGR